MPFDTTLFCGESHTGGLMRKKFVLGALVALFISACSGESPTKPNPVSPPQGADPIVPPPPPPRPVITFTAPSSAVRFGSTNSIEFACQWGTSAVAHWATGTSPNNSALVKAVAPSWYSVTCSNVTGTARDSVFLDVQPREIVVIPYIPTPSGYTIDTTSSKVVIGTNTSIIRGVGTVSFPFSTPDTVVFSLAGNAVYPKVLARVPKVFFDTWGDTIILVRIPRTWVVQKGQYTGVRAKTDLVSAYKQGPDGLSFYHRGQSQGRTDWTYSGLGWNNASFPANLWIDSAISVSLSGIAPTPSDSLRLVAGYSDLVQLIGWSPFSIAKQTPGMTGVRASIGNGPLALGGGRPDGADGLSGGVYYTTVQSRFGNKSETPHELFHVLGIGHTCAWASLMSAYCVWDTGVVYPETERDVAYLEMWQSVNDIRRKTVIRLHWGENLAGTQDEVGITPDKVLYITVPFIKP